MKGVIKFGVKGNLSPRFIRLLEILEKFGVVENRLGLPLYLLDVHSVFHVLLKRYHPYDMHVIQ